MQTHFKAKQLCVALTIAMSAIGLTACGGGSKSGGNSGGSNNAPIEKKTDTFPLPKDQWAEVGDTIELVKLSNNGLPLTYKVTSPDNCKLEDYKVTLLKASDNPEQPWIECSLIVNNSGGNRQFKMLSTGHKIKIFKKCGDNEKHSELRHLCIPKATTLDPITAPIGIINQPIKFTLKGFNLKDNLDKLKIKTNACNKINITNKYTDLNDKDAISFSCVPDVAGTFELTVSKEETQLQKTNITVELPKITKKSDYILFKTGIKKCANETETNIDCTEAALGDWYGLKQDGELQLGEDLNYTTKQHQNPITHETETCAQDNASGLIWEIKTDDGGLRDKDWTYTWFNPDYKTNNGRPGIQGQDTCGGTLATLGNKCNSKTYIEKLNEIQYCGYSDWRVPESHELSALIDFGQPQPPLLNQKVFTKNISKNNYLTATSAGVFNSLATINFDQGGITESEKDEQFGIIAVRID